jgi:hypothetical protein
MCSEYCVKDVPGIYQTYGGGGFRTRVPKASTKGYYMLIPIFIFFLTAPKGGIHQEAALQGFRGAFPRQKCTLIL